MLCMHRLWQLCRPCCYTYNDTIVHAVQLHVKHCHGQEGRVPSHGCSAVQHAPGLALQEQVLFLSATWPCHSLYGRDIMPKTRVWLVLSVQAYLAQDEQVLFVCMRMMCPC